MPTRKRKKRRINPGPILILGILVVLLSGIFYSPLTSISKASIVGAKPADRPYLESVLSSLNRIPWIKVNQRSVEASVQRIEGVDHATYSQNIFGRGRLVLHYRVPVARIRADHPIGLDPSGVMFETDSLPADLPMVTRPDSAHDLPAAIAGSFPCGDVAHLAVAARQLAPGEKLSIWFNKEGALCLNMGTGLVVLGACDDLDEKLHSLKDILDQQPGLLAKVASLNLTEPSHPATTYKKTRE